MFAYGLATQPEDQASIPNVRSSLETLDQLSSLLQEDDTAVQKVCVDFGAFFREVLSVLETPCESQYPYCYKNKCYRSSISNSNNNKFCTSSDTGNHCSKCYAHDMLSVARATVLLKVESLFGSHAPCCHCNGAAGFLRRLNDMKETISKIDTGLGNNLNMHARNVAMRDLRAVMKCVREKLRGNKCSTNEEDALAKEGAAAAAGRRTEQLDSMRAIMHANMHPCSLSA